jgi:hypothetical protein
MSIIMLDAADVPRLNAVQPVSRLVSAVESFVSLKGERDIIIRAFASFLVLWTVYHTVSNISVSTDSDTSEVSVWAHHFAFATSTSR